MDVKTTLLAIILFVAPVLSTEQNALPVDAAVVPPTRTLYAREPFTSPVIEFSSMPECAQFFCSSSDWQGPGLCPSVPCPSSTDSSCTTVTTDCFCNLKTPLECAWICDWSAWYHFENWYSNTCPNAKPVDFSGLPKCVRRCLPDQYIIYGCITLGRSCICNAQELFGCASKCDVQSNKTINNWFSDLCGTKLNVTVDTVPTSARSGAVVPRVRAPTPMNWYETFALVVAATSALVFVVAVILSKKRPQVHSHQKRT